MKRQSAGENEHSISTDRQKHQQQQPQSVTGGAAATASADDVFADDLDSGSERCGFVCHIMIVALATSYTGWIIVSISAFHSESVTSESRGLLLPSTWSMHLPTVAALLFFLAPILYGLINTTLPPSVDAIESLQDRFSVRPPRRKVYLSTRGGECDNIPCDTSSLLSYYQNPICDDDGVENNEDYDRIPEICDLDVADINDLLCPAARNVLHSRTRHAR